MKIPVYNQEKEEIGTVLLPKEIFDVKMNSDLVHQVVVSQNANRRKVIASTKDRAQVRGGGRKPWRQKGTGRARHGSIRSPLWPGGGVTFGPTKERVFKKEIPKKMRRKAMFMVLSAKVKDNEIFVLDGLQIERPKTKLMADVLKLFFGGKSGLVILPAKEDKIIRATRNIVNTSIMTAKDLTALDLMTYKYIVMPKEAIKVIKETFAKKEDSKK